MSAQFRLCALIPSYDNPLTVRAVVKARHLADILVVDDGSGPAGRRAVEEIGREGLAEVVHRTHNGGKGAAVKTGFERAWSRGFSHVLQIDADGQHDPEDVPRFLAEARAHPEALVLGQPVFDHSQPRVRALARQISVFWVNVETGGRVIADPQCGFRVYPLAAARPAPAATTWSSTRSCPCAWSGPTRRSATCPRACANSPRRREVSRISIFGATTCASRRSTRDSFWAGSRAASATAGVERGRVGGRTRMPMR